MGLSRRKRQIKKGFACIFAGLLILGNTVQVSAEETYRISYEVPPKERDDYTIVTEDLGGYEVCEGDSLWRISEELLGDGGQYMQLARENADVISDPDLIYPQMYLQVSRNVYVKKRTGANGIRTPEYRFGTPDGWRFGILGSGDVYANCALMGSGFSNVICLLRDKEQSGVKALSDWEKSKQTIEEYVRGSYAGKIADLEFHDYQSADGRVLRLFSYVYTIDGADYGYRGELNIHVCQGICQTEHIQAEFTGMDTEEDIRDIVLYMLASFEEFPGTMSVNGYNVSVAPDRPWALGGICNSFAWVDQYYDAVFGEIAEKEKPAQEKTARERILGL